ncbi:restriction endonuclease [Flavobacterium psychrophilum]|uniref:restriction endonuclease n=1 Tax=Flavobacterium psychrophilum TaxID=96345 RepID=UPI0004F9050C|nr:restriction endonuclease [Flavobacterium psychrophilum]AIN74097.1 restriction endonuclease [Flavobacterium psychrophilum FPG3]EKT2070457.1 restriction endonuclease [Flavobacterium psychrophilum]EKT2072822.1 restriction endonuclease [Flavobacterium psychrophilum]EKT4492232.1 restriction endonuclease [Flavobacterium psychrophilum]MBF2045521.1 restriction endonuclease [Flavobacterium psychrophilum]
MKSFAEIDIEKNGNYLKLLSAVSKLSGLFSESSVPFINYRVAENIFCRSFDAGNLSRSDTAFDANYNSVGVGLKTFVCSGNSSTEKVAEFNSLSRTLKDFKGKELALKLGEFRNDRINLANRVYDIENSLYHIVARKEKELLLYETDYNIIDVANIHSVKDNKASLQFEDGNNLYSFNYSKSTLFRKFIIPQNAFRLPIDIIEDPYSLLLELFEENKNLKTATDKLVKGENYVILPLYGIQKKEKFIFERSGLNQWNANGRKRDFGEIYIPIPAELHKKYPNFFPEKDQDFNLQIPTGEIFSASLCQQGRKALMTNPNKALSDWLLRKVLQLKEGEMATMEKLDKLGFDSVIITKNEVGDYKIDIMKTNTYTEFNNETE